MAMTREKFDALVARLENEAAKDEKSYRSRVFLLAILGYVYVFFILAVLAFLVGLLIWGAIAMGKTNTLFIKIGIVLLGLVFIILRSLWVRLEPPEGLELTPQQAGPLFQAVEEIRQKLDCPKPDHVLLTDDFNAAAAQVPRLGILGWQRNYLLVGLPLMQALSPEQFKSVLAHEFGHLSGNHSRFGGWVYRIQKTWYQLMEALEHQEHGGTFLFSRFFEWYAPYFSAYSFVLRRADEYVADRCSAEVVGARTAADALVYINAAGAFLEEKFWPSLYARANQQAEPPTAPFSVMRTAFRAGIHPEYASKWVNEALAREGDSEDTHPSLSQRLSALKQDAQLPPPPQQTAAEFYLGANVETLTEQLNHMWKETVDVPWRERFKLAQETRQQLEVLERKAAAGESLTADETWQRATFTEELHDEEAALPFYREALRAKPDDAAAHFAVGRILLSLDNEEGIGHIEKAMELEADAVLPGCDAIYTFLTKQGRKDEAQKYFKRAVQSAEQLQAAESERFRIDFKDKYLPHELPAAEVEKLREHLSRYPQFAEAYAVRKEVQNLPERPLYVIGVVARKAWYQMENEDEQIHLCQQLAEEINLKGDLIVIPLHSANAPLKKVMKNIADAKIYG